MWQQVRQVLMDSTAVFYKVCEPAARIGGIHYYGVAVCDLSVDSGSNRPGSACQLSL